MRTFFTLLTGGLLVFFGARTQSSAPYQFYYSNLHAHSGYSDGNQDSTSSGKP